MSERYCKRCGRPMIYREHPGLYNSRTGTRETVRQLMCPRFTRSWRNLWFGGTAHYAYSVDEGGRIVYELRYM